MGILCTCTLETNIRLIAVPSVVLQVALSLPGASTSNKKCVKKYNVMFHTVQMVYMVPTVHMVYTVYTVQMVYTVHKSVGPHAWFTWFTRFTWFTQSTYHGSHGAHSCLSSPFLKSSAMMTI